MIIPCRIGRSHIIPLCFFQISFEVVYIVKRKIKQKKNLSKKMLKMFDVEIDFSIIQQVVCIFVMQMEGDMKCNKSYIVCCAKRI